MVQIEELGKVIARIISMRQNNAARRIPEQIQVVYDALKLDTDFLMHTAPEDILRRLNQEDHGGIQRMEIAIKTLIEESYLYPDRRQAMLLRAKELLEYIQQTDKTFSLERISLIEEIQGLLEQ